MNIQAASSAYPAQQASAKKRRTADDVHSEVSFFTPHGDVNPVVATLDVSPTQPQNPSDEVWADWSDYAARYGAYWRERGVLLQEDERDSAYVYVLDLETQTVLQRLHKEHVARHTSCGMKKDTKALPYLDCSSTSHADGTVSTHWNCPTNCLFYPLNPTFKPFRCADVAVFMVLLPCVCCMESCRFMCFKDRFFNECFFILRMLNHF